MIVTKVVEVNEITFVSYILFRLDWSDKFGTNFQIGTHFEVRITNNCTFTDIV